MAKGDVTKGWNIAKPFFLDVFDQWAEKLAATDYVDPIVTLDNSIGQTMGGLAKGLAALIPSVGQVGDDLIDQFAALFSEKLRKKHKGEMGETAHNAVVEAVRKEFRVLMTIAAQPLPEWASEVTIRRDGGVVEKVYNLYGCPTVPLRQTEGATASTIKLADVPKDGVWDPCCASRLKMAAEREKILTFENAKEYTDERLAQFKRELSTARDFWKNFELAKSKGFGLLTHVRGGIDEYTQELTDRYNVRHYGSVAGPVGSEDPMVPLAPPKPRQVQIRTGLLTGLWNFLSK
jgi:hypothetical protein